MKHLTLVLTALFALLFLSPARAADGQPADGPLKTRWAKDVSPENVLPEYPRPQMVRKDWLNLNGLWDIKLGDGTESKILVPFAIESALSGVMKHSDRMTYRRSFEIPKGWNGRHVLLHFGAVDWETKVSVNGKQLGVHRGGYDPFSFDITEALKREGPQEITVEVFDPTDLGGQPRGKQKLQPGGIMYTPTSGIWQTVWLEPVPEAHITSLQLTPDLDAGCLHLTVGGSGTAEAVASDGGKRVAQVSGAAGSELKLAIPNPRPWSPDSPHLYDLRVSLTSGGQVLDEVTSYFALRQIALGKDEKGATRMLLNGKPVFQVGPLDQGFWPDGIYTAPTDEALRWDVAETKRLGFNCTRKHVKIEPDRWYYWCDKLGLMVWQDMPCGNSYTDKPQPMDKAQFRWELASMVTNHWNHPSIIMWVLFNESQGQHDTESLVADVKALDPSRLVNNASGGADKNCGDVINLHSYPGPASPNPEANRAAVLGEFGGLGLAVNGHTWSQRTWGYKGTQSIEDLTRGYEKLLAKAWALNDKSGLSAAIYTQLTDVETECNGLVTYDREVNKVIADRAAAVNSGKLPPVPVIKEVVPTSQLKGVNWHFTVASPANDWMKSTFDDSAWKEGPGGFGTAGTPGAVVRTEWKTSDIWLRREFDWPASKTATPVLSVHHDEDVEIYINGVLAGKADGFVSDYEEMPVTPEGARALKPGKNVLALHCHQTTGGQYINVGILTEAPAPAQGEGSAHEPVIPYPEALQEAGVAVSKMADGQSESLIVGNGDLYGIVWGKEGGIRLRITKNDIWDARVDTSKDGPLPKVNIRTRAVTGSKGAPPSYERAFPQPLCAAALRIGSSSVANGTLDLQHAVATVTLGNGNKTDVRVLADRNALLITTRETITIEPVRAGQTGKTNGVEWLHVTLPGDLDYKGMEYCLAVVGTAGSKAVSLVTSFDITTGDVRGAAIALASKTVAEVERSQEQLVARHEKVWGDFWARSGVELGDRDLQHWWYRMMYFARTVSQPGGRFPAGLMPPLATDSTPWHADFHFNYNSWQPFWSVISANHADLADPWIWYVHGLLPRAQWQAREVFDCEGVYYSISQFLHEPDPAVCKSVNKRSLVMSPWGMTIGMVGMTAQNLWHKHLCDPDGAYLEAKIYPSLREAARFYLSFMKQCRKDAAGKVLLGPSYSPEHGAMGIDNCPFDVAYVHYTFEAFDRASQELGKDRTLAAECLAMKALLADYPVALDANGKPVVVDWTGCKYKEIGEHNLTVPASPVFPAEQVTWFSPEPVKELFRRTIKDTRFNGNNSHVIFNIAKARLSMPEAVPDTKRWFKSRELPNGLFVWQGHQHGTFMPESIGVAALVTEFLVQSVGDVIRVFPCWPKEQDAKFANLRAQGGFLVSAEQKNGQVIKLEITSTVGGTLRLLNPWTGKIVERTTLPGQKLAFTGLQ